MSETSAGYFARIDNDAGQLKSFLISPLQSLAEHWLENGNLDLADMSSASNSEEDEKLIGKISDSSPFEILFHEYFLSVMANFPLASVVRDIQPIFSTIYLEQQFSSYLDNNCSVIRTSPRGRIYAVTSHDLRKLARDRQRLDDLEKGMARLPSAVLMSLVAIFDSNMSDIVRMLLSQRRDRLQNSSKSLTVSEILGMSSFDDVIEKIVDEEIYDLMRGSHEEQVEYIEKNFAVKIRSEWSRWPDFVEIFERRNLTAHGINVATERYEKNCTRVGSAFHSIKKGEAVTIEPKYLRHTIDIFVEFGVLLIFSLWRKQEAATEERAFDVIANAGYLALSRGRHTLASRILEYALSINTKHCKETNRKMMTVNLANAYKKLENNSRCQEILSNVDWSATSDNYNISVAALRDDVNQVVNLMESVVRSNAVTKHDFREWPVFDWVRDDPAFAEKFKSLFLEDVRPSSSTQIVDPASGANGKDVSGD